MMALTSLLPSETNTTTTTTTTHHQHHYHRRRKKKPPPPPPPHPPPPLRPRTTTTTTIAAARTTSNSSSWSQLKSLLSCRSSSASAQVHDPSSAKPILRRSGPCGPSFCAFRTAATSECGSAASSLRETAPLTVRRRHHQVAAAPVGLRGLSGCYECRAVAVQHAGRYPGRPRTELCTCPVCGEVFTKAESLDHHQATRHAVSELGPEDSGRNIVEIIFKSSWLSRGANRRPTCQIVRILKVHNTPAPSPASNPIAMPSGSTLAPPLPPPRPVRPPTATSSSVSTPPASSAPSASAAPPSYAPPQPPEPAVSVPPSTMASPTAAAVIPNPSAFGRLPAAVVRTTAMTTLHHYHQRSLRKPVEPCLYVVSLQGGSVARGTRRISQMTRWPPETATASAGISRSFSWPILGQYSLAS